MTNVSLFKRAFTFAVVAMTILWTMGAGLAPLMTSAQVSLSEGDLIKGESFSTVYYYDGDGRWAYPNSNIYFSWHEDFSDVVTISDSQLSGIALEGNVLQRPGTEWIKITSNDKVYAVGQDGTLFWIETEAVAEALYGGSGWNTNIQDIADVFFADYTEGASLMSADNLFDGALVESNGTTYLMWDGMLREVSSAGMSANGLQSKHVLDTTVDVSGLTMGDDLSGSSDEVSDVSQQAEGDGTPVAEGDISVSVASSTAAGASLPGGATAVEMATWKFMGSGTIDSLVVSLGGVNASTDISNVYIYQGDERLTESRSVNSATREATFSNLGVAVSEGSPVYLSAVVELATSPSGGETVYFGLEDVDAVGSGADISGSFPLNGNTFTLVSDNAGTVTFSKNGTITDPAIGSADAEIGEFKVEADNEDAEIEHIRLKIDNATDHEDYKLWDGSTLIANGVWASGDLVDFALSEAFVIEDGDSDIFTVTADIGGETGDDIKVYLDKDVDVTAIGGDFGFGMQVTRTTFDGDSCTASTGDCSFSTIDGGDVTFTFNGPTSGDIAIDASDQILMEFTLSTTQDITVKDLDIILAADDDGDGSLEFESETTGTDGDNDGLIRGSGTEANFKDVSIRYADTMQRLLGPAELSTTDGADDAYQLIDLSDDFFMEAGASLDLVVTVDVDNNDPGSNIVGAAINMGNISIEDGNGDALTVGTEIVPSGDINGNEFTTQSPSLTFALASSPISFTTVQGALGVTVLGLTVEAGEAEDVLITDLTIDTYGDDTAAASTDYTNGGEANAQVEDFFSTCSLYDGDGTLLDGAVGATTSGQFLVFEPNWTVEAGEVEGLDVVCDLSNPSNASTRYFAFDIDASTNVTAETADGNTPTITVPASLNGNIDSGAAPDVAVSVATAGSLTASLDSSSPESMLLRAGSSDNWVSSFQLEATNEAFTVETISFYETQNEDDDTASAGDLTGYANNVGQVTISYLNEAGDTVTSDATMSGRTVKFAGESIYVDPEDDAVVDVYVDVPVTDRTTGGSATSSERIEISLFDGDNSGNENFKAVGAGSGTTLGETAISDTDGNMHHIVEGLPTLSLHANSPSGDGFTPGTGTELLRFTVLAEGEDVVLSEIIFDISTTDNGSNDWNQCDTTSPGSDVREAADFDFFDAADDGNELEGSDSDWTLLKETGADCDGTAADLGFVQLELSTPEVIAEDDSTTFILEMNTTNASSSANDSVSVEIPEDPIVAVTGFLAAGQDLTTAVTDYTDKSLDIDSSNPFGRGDIVCLEDEDDDSTDCAAANEKVLVQDTSSLNFYVNRGYLGTTTDETVTASTDLSYLPSSFVWFDDGDSTPTGGATENAIQGSYLVPGLPLDGGNIVF